MQYRYVAVDEAGRIYQGLIEGESEAAAEARLWEAKLVIVELRPYVVRPSRTIDWAAWVERAWPVTPGQLGGLWGDLAGLMGGQAREDGTVRAAGPLPLPTALLLLSERTTHPAYRRLLAGVAAATAGGEPFLEALQSRTDALSPLEARLLGAGEARGRLVPALRELAAGRERDRAIAAPLQAALWYALVAGLAALAAIILLPWAFWPALGRLAGQPGLAWPTASVLAGAGLVQRSGGWIAAALVLIVVAAVAYGRMTVQGRRFFSLLAWRAPGAGRLSHSREMARLCRWLAAISWAGIPWSEVPDLLPGLSSNVVLQEALLHVRSELLDGEPLSEALRRTAFFPPGLIDALEPEPADSAPADKVSALPGGGAAGLLSFRPGPVAGEEAPEGRRAALPALPAARLAALTEHYEDTARQTWRQAALWVRRSALWGALVVAVWVLIAVAAAWQSY